MSYQKRKLEIEEGQQAHSHPLKMLKHNISITTIVNIGTFEKDLNEGKYKFKLTEKTARTNLMKAANRNLIDIETKQTCKNIRFSAGAYFHVVLPVVRQWITLFQTKQSFTVGSLNFTVEELEERNDLAAKHFNTKIVFCVNGGKVVIHCYNSTQNLRVDGTRTTKVVLEAQGNMFSAVCASSIYSLKVVFIFEVVFVLRSSSF